MIFCAYVRKNFFLCVEKIVGVRKRKIPSVLLKFLQI